MADDVDDFDAYDFILDVVAELDAVLTFPSRVGPVAKVGYHRGRWTMVYSHSEYGGFTAMSVEREQVREMIEADAEDVEADTARQNPAWHWLVEGGYEEQEMIRAHCMCGEFKYSTNINRVQKWVRSHGQSCYHDPEIHFDYDD
jgi:hypothetical protein